MSIERINTKPAKAIINKPKVHKPAPEIVYKAKDVSLKPKKTGRPTKYSTKLHKEICSLITQGNSLIGTCEQLNIAYNSVINWLNMYPDFLKDYTRARELQADWYADEILKTIDNAPANRDEIERAKVRAEALKWIASKLKPRRYGDKLDLTSDGERIEQPIYGGASVKREPIEGEVVKPHKLPPKAK